MGWNSKLSKTISMKLDQVFNTMNQVKQVIPDKISIEPRKPG